MSKIINKLKKVVRRPFGRVPKADPRQGGTLSTSEMIIYENISRLIEHGFMEVKLDKDSSSLFLSLSCYRAFCCDRTGIFIDDGRARGFLSNVRFYINFRRAYLAGRKQGLIDDALERDTPYEDAVKSDPDAAFNIYVATSDDKGILLYGMWTPTEVQIRPYKDPPQPSLNGGSGY